MTAPKAPQQELFKAETAWFHIFKTMIDSGDVARMGPYAVTVYLVIKSHTKKHPHIRGEDAEPLPGGRHGAFWR